MVLDRESYKINVSEPDSESESDHPHFNVDCEGLDFDTYQFLLQDIAQGIEDGNRMYGYGEPGYIGADGNFYPLSDNIIAEVKSRPRPIPKVNPMPPRPRRKRIELEDSGPLLEEVMLARGLLHVAKKRKEETG